MNKYRYKLNHLIYYHGKIALIASPKQFLAGYRYRVSIKSGSAYHQPARSKNDNLKIFFVFSLNCAKKVRV